MTVTWRSKILPYIALFVGLGVSIAANVRDVYIVAAQGTVQWTPGMGPLAPQFIAGESPTIFQTGFGLIWPIIAFLGIELLAARFWPTTWPFLIFRWGGMSAVAGVAGFISYKHIYAVALHDFGDTQVAKVAAIGIDGLMAMATAYLIALRVVPVAAQVVVKAPRKKRTWPSVKMPHLRRKPQPAMKVKPPPHIVTMDEGKRLETTTESRPAPMKKPASVRTSKPVKSSLELPGDGVLFAVDGLRPDWAAELPRAINAYYAITESGVNFTPTALQKELGGAYKKAQALVPLVLKEVDRRGKKSA